MNGLAIAGFVVSIASLFFNLYGLVGAVGLALSGIALFHINHNGGNGKGLAKAGVVIGVLSVVYGIVVLALIM